MNFIQYAQDTTIALASQCWYAGSVESSQVDYVFNAFFKYNIYMKTSFLYRNVIRFTLVNVYVDLVVFTRIAGTS